MFCVQNLVRFDQKSRLDMIGAGPLRLLKFFLPWAWIIDFENRCKSSLNSYFVSGMQHKAWIANAASESCFTPITKTPFHRVQRNDAVSGEVLYKEREKFWDVFSIKHLISRLKKLETKTFPVLLKIIIIDMWKPSYVRKYFVTSTLLSKSLSFRCQNGTLRTHLME